MKSCVGNYRKLKSTIEFKETSIQLKKKSQGETGQGHSTELRKLKPRKFK